MAARLAAPQKAIFYVFLTLVCISVLIFQKSTGPWSNSGTEYWSRIKNIDNNINRAELEDLIDIYQDNSSLIQYLRRFHVYPPSSRAYRYSTLDKSRLFYVKDSRLTTAIIQSYLKNMTNGLFVEAGANNGADELSNTLVLERDYNWTGLLIEGSPLVFPKLIAAHRKSWKSDLLLSKYTHTKPTIFYQTKNIYAGKQRNSVPGNAVVASMGQDGETPVPYFELLTVPLYSLVAACNLERIDYLSLDVEGSELEILMNFPFEKVLIRTMMVEINVLGKTKTQRLVDFLSSKGYYKHPTQPTFRDMIFIHKSVMNNQ